MLGHQDRQVDLARQGPEQLAERVDAAGRGPDRQDARRFPAMCPQGRGRRRRGLEPGVLRPPAQQPDLAQQRGAIGIVEFARAGLGQRIRRAER